MHHLASQQQQQQHFANQNRLLQSQNYNEDPSLYDSAAAAAAAAMSQQAQFDLMQNNYYQNNSLFQRNNAKRNTLRRSQRVMDNSNEEINGGAMNFNMKALANLNIDPNVFMSLSPQQQQQLIMLHSQQFTNNLVGQELINMNNQNLMGLDQQQLHSFHKASDNKQAASGSTVPHQAKSIDMDYLKMPNAAPQIPRRKSLPSIIKIKSYKEDETAHSSSELNSKNQETFIIENGIRKRVTEKVNSNLYDNGDKKVDERNVYSINDEADEKKNKFEAFNKKYKLYEYDDDETPELPTKIVLESITTLNSGKNTNNKRVSMPSIPAYLNPKFANKGI
jgi:hypothetical protein